MGLLKRLLTFCLLLQVNRNPQTFLKKQNQLVSSSPPSSFFSPAALACIAERNSWTLNPDPAGNPNCVRSICPDCSAWLNRSSCDWNCGVRRSSSRFCVALCSSGRNCDRDRKGQTSCISRCMGNSHQLRDKTVCLDLGNARCVPPKAAREPRRPRVTARRFLVSKRPSIRDLSVLSVAHLQRGRPPVAAYPRACSPSRPRPCPPRRLTPQTRRDRPARRAARRATRRPRGSRPSRASVRHRRESRALVLAARALSRAPPGSTRRKRSRPVFL